MIIKNGEVFTALCRLGGIYTTNVMLKKKVRCFMANSINVLQPN